MSGRLLLRVGVSGLYEPVTALRVVEVGMGSHVWVGVLVLRESGECVRAICSHLHLEGATFFGFLDFLSGLPGWNEAYRKEILRGVASAHARQAR